MKTRADRRAWMERRKRTIARRIDTFYQGRWVPSDAQLGIWATTRCMSIKPQYRRNRFMMGIPHQEKVAIKRAEDELAELG